MRSFEILHKKIIKSVYVFLLVATNLSGAVREKEPDRDRPSSLGSKFERIKRRLPFDECEEEGDVEIKELDFYATIWIKGCCRDDSPQRFGFVAINESRYKFELASIDDVDELISIYDEIEGDAARSEDAKKIVIYPREVRRDIILNSLMKRRIFVIRDTENRHKIISFLKMFLIWNLEELSTILSQEIKPILAPWSHPFLLRKKTYIIPSRKLDQASFDNIFYVVEHPSSLEVAAPSPAAATPYSLSPILGITDEIDEKAAYIYYGGAYTAVGYRGNRFNSLLQQAALKELLPQIISHITSHDGSAVHYLFGQVDANASSKSPLRAFATFVKALKRGLRQYDNDDIKIYSSEYTSCKPHFYMEGRELRKAASDDPRSMTGIGKILRFDLGF